MIEHHSMALLTSEELLQKSSNYKVRKLASNIINNQEEEIKEMKNLLKEKTRLIKVYKVKSITKY